MILDDVEKGILVDLLLLLQQRIVVAVLLASALLLNPAARFLLRYVDGTDHAFAGRRHRIDLPLKTRPSARTTV